MHSIFYWLGGLTDNYVALVMILAVVVGVLTMPFNIMQKIQQKKANKANQDIKAIQKEHMGDQEAMTEATLAYWEKHNMNPVRTMVIQIIGTILNFAILMSVFGVFSPIKNFTKIPEETKIAMVEVYKEEFNETSCSEITLVNHIDELKPYLKDVATGEEINEIVEVKNKFKLGDLQTTIVPAKSADKRYLAIPIIMFSITALSTLKSIIEAIKKKNKLSIIVSVGMGIPMLAMMGYFDFAWPIIMCIYFAVKRVMGFIEKAIYKAIDKKTKNKGEETDVENHLQTIQEGEKNTLTDINE